MAKNSVTGCFGDIEISFNIDIDCIRMSVQNLVSDEKQVRLMYQKQPTSGLANWKQFELTHQPVSLRLPTEVLEAYRLTFFIDDAEPISARVESVLAELKTLEPESPVVDLPENTETVTDTQPIDTPNKADAHTSEETEVVAAEQIETTLDLPEMQLPREALSNANTNGSEESEVTADTQIAAILDLPEMQLPIETLSDAKIDSTEESEVTADTQIEVTPDLREMQLPIETLLACSESQQAPDEQSVSSHAAAKSSAIRKVKPEMLNAGSHSEFKISVTSLPPSALVEQQKPQMGAAQESTSFNTRRKPKQKENGFFGQIVSTLKGAKRGKAYYQERGETIQNEFQDQLSKLERDYNEGYGLNLIDWKPETLCEEEIAIFLLNLMVNEIIAWQKETGRATSETGAVVEILAEVDTLLRQTLKQTRGISTPSPTLFPNLLAENERDMEKIRNECDAYLHRFTGKLIEQEKKHATKIEILSFRKFLTEFIRDFLFAEISKNIQGIALPKRLNWFLELVDSEVMPIEIGKTKVLSSHHKVKDARPSECESGTIVGVIAQGLQSKDGKRVNQMAVVIEAE